MRLLQHEVQIKLIVAHGGGGMGRGSEAFDVAPEYYNTHKGTRRNGRQRGCAQRCICKRTIAVHIMYILLYIHPLPVLGTHTLNTATCTCIYTYVQVPFTYI